MKSEKLEILWTKTSGFNGLVPPRVPNRNIIDNLFLWKHFRFFVFLVCCFPWNSFRLCLFTHHSITRRRFIDGKGKGETKMRVSRAKQNYDVVFFQCLKKTCDKSKRLPGSPAGLPNRQTGSVLYQFLWNKKTIGAVGVPRHRRDATQNRNKIKTGGHTERNWVTSHLQN